MTIHTFYHYECDNCSKAFIPYKKGMTCPACGAATDEYYDFVNEAVISLEYNLKRNKSFVPSAWLMDGIGDTILNSLFGMFENLRTYGYTGARKALQYPLDLSDFREDIYLKDHILEIALEIQKVLVEKDLLLPPTEK